MRITGRNCWRWRKRRRGRAKELGAKKIAVTVHRKSRKVDFDVLQSLTKIPIHTIYYQSETELEYNLSHTDCDCVIGAAELLRQTNRTVLDIAGQFGYDNASKFAKAFRDVIGVSPREYRSGAEYDSCAPRLHNADAD